MPFQRGNKIGSGWKVPTLLSGGAAAPLLLDNLSNVAAAYSFRKLRTAYAGSAVRIRRSSDNAEQDCGFVGNDFDAAGAATFIGGGSGNIPKPYDQSGNSNDAAQATAGLQALYVASAQNSQPGFRLNGSSQYWSMTAALAGANQTIFAVAKFANAGDTEEYLMGSTSILWGYDDDAQGMRVLSTSGGYFGGLKRTDVRGTTHLFELVIASNSATLFIDGSQQTGTVALGANFAANLIGAYESAGAKRWFGGDLMELICLGSVSGAERTALRDNINAYWAIY